ncbi:hypothetical protein [Bacteroides clarus]|uniref:hypothetical protein n=1 Tax=Bacteroides clarus TaxID=626929 RepID=UPI003FEFDE69
MEHEINKFPTRGTGNTNGWYRQFQALVLKIPTVGIRRTNRWYFRFQPLVLKVPYQELTI